MLRRLAARALRHLPTERLIQAVGNVELRDGFEWLREETLAEVDRCLADSRTIRAFEHAMAGVVMGMVLERAYVNRSNPQIVSWIDDFFRRHPHVPVAAIARTLVGRRIRQVRAPRVPPADISALALACAYTTEGHSARPRSLVVTRDSDQRTRRVLGGFLKQLTDAAMDVTWLRITGQTAGVRVTRMTGLTEVDVPIAALRLPWDGTDLDVKPVERLAATGDAFAAAMAARIPQAVDEWAAGRLFGQQLFAQGGYEFVLFISEKYPFARALITEARRAGVSTFAYFASIELGAPSLYRYAVDHLLVPNAWTARGLVRLGFDPNRLAIVGTTEIDDVIGFAADVGDLPQAPVRLLLLTKWPDCAIGNRPILDATLATCVRAGRPFHVIIRPHPKDRVSYRSYESPHVTVSSAAYEQQFAWANVVVVTGLSNSVFHALAIGKPMVVVSTNPRIDLGQRHLFTRADVPAAVRYSEHVADGARDLSDLLATDLEPYTLPGTLVDEFFHSLDGRTCARIREAIVARIPAPVSA